MGETVKRVPNALALEYQYLLQRSQVVPTTQSLNYDRDDRGNAPGPCSPEGIMSNKARYINFWRFYEYKNQLSTVTIILENIFPIVNKIYF